MRPCWPWCLLTFTPSELTLHRAAHWNELGRGSHYLHIDRPAETETVRAIEGEVLKLCVNGDAAQPWRGRSPFSRPMICLCVVGLAPMTGLNQRTGLFLPLDLIPGHQRRQAQRGQDHRRRRRLHPLDQQPQRLAFAVTQHRGGQAGSSSSAGKSVSSTWRTTARSCGRLKGYRRIFSRFEKLDVMYRAFLNLALIIDMIK